MIAQSGYGAASAFLAAASSADKVRAHVYHVGV